MKWIWHCLRKRRPLTRACRHLKTVQKPAIVSLCLTTTVLQIHPWSVCWCSMPAIVCNFVTNKTAARICLTSIEESYVRICRISIEHNPACLVAVTTWASYGEWWWTIAQNLQRSVCHQKRVLKQVKVLWAEDRLNDTVLFRTMSKKLYYTIPNFNRCY